jgi:hypothetical protein
MTSTLLIYFVLASVTVASDGARTNNWEFSHIEHVNGFNSREYCEQLAGEVAEEYEGRPGNMRAICMDDQGVTT